ARMLGLDAVLQVAHSTEDLLGAIRDGRLVVRRDLVDLLLTACDGVARAMPGVTHPVSDDDLVTLVAALGRALNGEQPVLVPRLESVEPEGGGLDDIEEPVRIRGSDSMRVAATKVYDLLDTVGEAELDARRVERSSATLGLLVGDQARWAKTVRALVAETSTQLPAEVDLALHRLLGASDAFATEARALRELVDDTRARLAQVRDGAMSLAMVPVRRVVTAFPRLVRDVAAATGKEVRLVLIGEDVELDKQVLDGVADALKHLVINAVDHGCEPPEMRTAAGKPAQATVTVSARSAGGTVVLEVTDDGAGIDEAVVRSAAVAAGLLPADSTLTGASLLQLLFAPALSTATAVTETSGRGVGLDVVKIAAEDLGGAVEVRTVAGAGTTFALTLPVTLGVLRCLIARVGGERYAVPVPGVVESISLKDAQVHTVAGAAVVVRHGTSLPLLDLGAALGVPGERAPRAAIVVKYGERQVAWAVDVLDGELELVVKDLGPFLGRLPVITGATIDGDGTVMCLVDLRELADRAAGAPAVSSAATASPTPAAEAGAGRRARVLVVEDSVGVRELERVILEGAGYDVVTAVDGLDGASRLRGDPADLVLSDVEMPGMDGFALTRTIRRTRGWEQVPVIIMTSRGDEADQREGLEAGASAYLLKGEFDQAQLVDAVRRLVGR
ncbi:MAG TPA: response regulator, partial [Mycobacteriales bacterium]|nr:response regulator [Mycobacteriales bacterium]